MQKEKTGCQRLTREMLTTMKSTSSNLANTEIASVELPKKASEDRYIDENKEVYELVKAERLEGLIRASGLGKRFQERTFENFVTSESNNDIYDRCVDYAKNFKELLDKEKGLLFTGSVGTGKTHLAAAIANYIIKIHNISVKFMCVSTLLSEIKRTYKIDSKATECQTISKLSNVELLIIDDLGKELTSEWSNSIIYTIINNRYERYKPTIITTNFSIKKLEEKVGEATVSRLLEMCEGIKLEGPDFRKIRLMK